MPQEISEAYIVRRPPRQTASVVFASPHSGTVYPEDLLARSLLDRRQIRSSEDAFVDRLFDMAPDHGAPLLSARAPRAYLDLNRAVDELDPALIEGIERAPHNPRISSGLGVIPRVVAGGRAIYSGKLARAEAEERIRRFWHPYHGALRQLIEETREAFGIALLVDCHSMPHEAIGFQSRSGGQMPDIVLGDRFGAAARGDIVDRVEAAFAATGLKVGRNAPFAGAYITQAYGRPSRGVHVVQVEIDRSLYMDETRIEPRPDFEDFRRLMAGAVGRIADSMPEERPLAAE
ncbi:N-formylglutamate amidohydrolase [Pseudogemmobacter sonorensis]|uniref:N-formylglutamate amidohydrolase n=1 Tax=Pseudogemmobacter sonorensis TaxID=2989681 RepID=UPI0036A8DF8D